MASEFSKTYNSFSGVDIKAVFGSRIIAEIQAISYSITREKAPLYTMGSADPRSFSRGKRGIAGTLIFLVFDRHALLGTFGMIAKKAGDDYLKFMSDKDDFVPNTSSDNLLADVPITTVAGAALSGGLEDLGESQISSIDDDQTPEAPWFSDQIPPFDVTLAAANEYGAFAVMRIYGLELLNEGYGVSIDDIVSEMQHTYVARTLVAWQPVISTKTAQLFTS
jgi:hypothetical protein